MSHVIGVLGASGAVGASTLAAAAGVRAAATGCTVVCVDARPHGAGLDVVLGLEQAPGLRWDDLVAVDGPVDGPDLLDRLPALPAGPACLAHSRLVAEVHERFSAGQPRPEAAHHIREALLTAAGVVLVDLPWAGHPDCEWWVDWCDSIALVGGDGLLDMAAAAAVAPLLANGPAAAGLVVRERSAQSPDFAGLYAARLELPLWATLAQDRGAVLALYRGDAPGQDSRGGLARAADRVLLAALAGTDDDKRLEAAAVDGPLMGGRVVGSRRGSGRLVEPRGAGMGGAAS